MLVESYAGGRAQRRRRDDPGQRGRALAADAAARAGVVPAPPGDRRRGRRRPGRRRRDDAQRHHADPAAARGGPAVPVRARLGGARGRASAGPRLRRSRTRAIAAGLAREEQTRTFAPDLFAIHPMHALEAEEEIVFLADAFLSHVPESGAARAGLPRLDRRPGLRAGLRPPAPDAPAAPVAEEAARRAGASLGAEDTGPPRATSDVLRARFPQMQLVHLHRDPRETIASGASLNTVLHRLHSDDVDPHRIGREWLERMGVDQRPRRGHARHVGRHRPARSRPGVRAGGARPAARDGSGVRRARARR